jgi:multidrug resistance protein
MADANGGTIPTVAAAARRSPLAVVYLTVFLDLLGFGMVIPILPIYATTMHARDREVGLLLAVYSVMQLFFAPIWGRLSDRVGRRPVLLLSIAGSCASQAGYALASSLGGLFIARGIAGMCGANISAAQAYVADVTDAKSRAAGMGKLGAALGIGFVAGPSLGGLLAHHGGPRLPFVVASVLAGVNLILGAILLEEPRTRGDRSPSRALSWPALVRTVSSPQLLTLILLLFTITFGFANLEATFSLFLQRRYGFDTRAIAWVFAFIGITIAVVQGGLVRRLVARFGERALVVGGTGAMAAGMLMLCGSRTLSSLLLSLAVLSIGNALNTPSLSSLISRAAGTDRQGGVLGVSQSFGALARVFGPIVGGVLLELGEAAPYFAGAAIMGLAFLIALGRVEEPPAEAAA